MLQREHYQNEDIHLTVACLRARRSQSSLQDVCYERQDRIAHNMPKYSTSSVYSNTYNDNRCRIHEEKAELKRRLQQVQRCEAEAEINRKKRAEQWRQLVLKEEREEHERKRKIEKLQKLIDKEMQRKHRRHHTDVNSANSSTHITEQPPVEIDSTEQTAPSLTSTVDEEPSNIKEKTDESSITTTVQADSPDDITVAETDSPDDITVAETDSPDDITVAETDSPDDITIDEIDSPDDITVAETDSPDGITVTETDSPDDITVAETDNHDDITTAESDSPGDITVAETDNHVDITTAETDNHNDITTAETDNHDDITTAEKDNHDDITKDLPQRTLVNTELQIQQTGVVVFTQPETNEESEATPTVQTTSDVTKTQQCNCKELQTQDTAVRITQPAAHKSDATLTVQIATESQIQPPDVTVTTQSEASEESEATLTVQIITDSDTRSESHDTQIWYHLNNTDDIYRTPESMSRVFICCHSEYSCEILYLLLYS